jgi:hypothetical protein
VAGTSPAAALSVEVVRQDLEHDLRAVDHAGTLYATVLGDGDRRLWASGDGGQSFQLRGALPIGDAFGPIAVLGDDTLLADTVTAGKHTVARSTDHGATWQDVLPLGGYRLLQPHSVAELDGAVYLAEYQVAAAIAPIHLWFSADAGATWSVRHVLEGYRHAHAVIADAGRGALWLLMGDGTGGLLRSLDGGTSFAPVVGSPDGVAVDASVLGDGGLLFGRDALFHPAQPAVVRLDGEDHATVEASLPGPSYSIHALAGGGGFLLGETHEVAGDVYPPDDSSAHLFGSGDGRGWTELMAFTPLSYQDYTRADVRWQLPTGEALVEVANALGYGPGGKGYLVLKAKQE